MKKYCILLMLALTLYLGQYQGFLALWKTGSPVPQQVYPYKVSLYPKIDQRVLTEGIAITSQEQLAKLLEDYLS